MSIGNPKIFLSFSPFLENYGKKQVFLRECIDKAQQMCYTECRALKKYGYINRTKW